MTRWKALAYGSGQGDTIKTMRTRTTGVGVWWLDILLISMSRRPSACLWNGCNHRLYHALRFYAFCDLLPPSRPSTPFVDYALRAHTYRRPRTPRCSPHLRYTSALNIPAFHICRLPPAGVPRALFRLGLPVAAGTFTNTLPTTLLLDRLENTPHAGVTYSPSALFWGVLSTTGWLSQHLPANLASGPYSQRAAALALRLRLQNAALGCATAVAPYVYRRSGFASRLISTCRVANLPTLRACHTQPYRTRACLLKPAEQAYSLHTKHTCCVFMVAPLLAPPLSRLHSHNKDGVRSASIIRARRFTARGLLFTYYPAPVPGLSPL